MTNHAGVLHGDPKNTFLTSTEVIRRYRWGRTKGYQMLRSPGFPRSIGGAYRLDTLAAWEDRQLTRSADSSADTGAAGGSDHPLTDAATTAHAGDTEAVSGTGAAWSPSTRRPATRRHRDSTNGGK